MLNVAEQEKEGKDIQLPTSEINMQKLALIEKAASRIKLEDQLLELQKKGIRIDPVLKQKLLKNDMLCVKILLVVNELCQKVMLRPVGMERHQLIDSEQLELHRLSITIALANLGFINEVKPQNKNPAVLLFLGASETTVTERFNALLAYIGTGDIKSGTVYLLGGDRALWAVDEPITVELVSERIYNQKSNNKPLSAIYGQVNADFKQRATKVTDPADTKKINGLRTSLIRDYQDTYHIKWPTETDMMVSIAEKIKLKHKGFAVVTVDTMMQADKFGKLTKRPVTRDTIVSFKKNYTDTVGLSENKKINVLAISSQPHILYQKKVIEEVLGTEKFNIEMAGNGVDAQSYNIHEAFDALARSIFAGLKLSLQESVSKCT